MSHPFHQLDIVNFCHASIVPDLLFHAIRYLRPHLKKITVPTLIIVGRHDFITNVAMAEEIVKHIPNARLEIFEDSGHYALVEEPEKFYRVIEEFVES